MVAYNIDARPPLRYNAAVKWVRNIVFAALALFALFLVLSNISTSGGGKSRLDDSPTPVELLCPSNTVSSIGCTHLLGYHGFPLTLYTAARWPRCPIAARCRSQSSNDSISGITGTLEREHA